MIFGVENQFRRIFTEHLGKIIFQNIFGGKLFAKFSPE
jgi:hypothetical protein